MSVKPILTDELLKVNSALKPVFSVMEDQFRRGTLGFAVLRYWSIFNFNFKLRYCGVLRICGMRYFWRFGQRYLIQKKLFYMVSDPFLVWLVSDRLGKSGNKLKDVVVEKCWRAYATPAIRKLFENLCLQSLALTKVSFNDFPLRYDSMGGS